MPTTLQTAQALHASGYSVIPTKKDKRPLVSWKEYMTRQPTDKDLSDWLRDFDQALKDIQSTQPKDTP